MWHCVRYLCRMYLWLHLSGEVVSVYVVKAYLGVGGIATHIFKLGTTECEWSVFFLAW
jgi:hypothetical protein